MFYVAFSADYLDQNWLRKPRWVLKYLGIWGMKNLKQGFVKIMEEFPVSIKCISIYPKILERTK